MNKFEEAMEFIETSLDHLVGERPITVVFEDVETYNNINHYDQMEHLTNSDILDDLYDFYQGAFNDYFTNNEPIPAFALEAQSQLEEYDIISDNEEEIAASKEFYDDDEIQTTFHEDMESEFAQALYDYRGMYFDIEFVNDQWDYKSGQSTLISKSPMTVKEFATHGRWFNGDHIEITLKNGTMKFGD